VRPVSLQWLRLESRKPAFSKVGAVKAWMQNASESKGLTLFVALRGGWRRRARRSPEQGEAYDLIAGNGWFDILERTAHGLYEPRLLPQHLVRHDLWCEHRLR
jgi:hypothetical protein